MRMLTLYGQATQNRFSGRQWYSCLMQMTILGKMGLKTRYDDRHGAYAEVL